MNTYKIWFSRVEWIGIVVNMFFVIPLFFIPEKLLSLLHIQIVDPIIWGRVPAMLLFLISVFYIPAAIDPDRYRAVAWLSVIPSRAAGATFFLCAVLFFGQDKGFLSIALVDLFFGTATGILLVLAVRAENKD